jgi:multidrug efflux pump subunit AcrB
MSDDSTDLGHGHSPAAWTAVVVMLVAVALGTLFFFLEMPLFVWASVGLLVVGALVGLIMSKAGYGAYGDKYLTKGH